MDNKRKFLYFLATIIAIVDGLLINFLYLLVEERWINSDIFPVVFTSVSLFFIVISSILFLRKKEFKNYYLINLVLFTVLFLSNFIWLPIFKSSIFTKPFLSFDCPEGYREEKTSTRESMFCEKLCPVGYNRDSEEGSCAVCVGHWEEINGDSICQSDPEQCSGSGNGFCIPTETY